MDSTASSLRVVDVITSSGDNTSQPSLMKTEEATQSQVPQQGPADQGRPSSSTRPPPIVTSTRKIGSSPPPRPSSRPPPELIRRAASLISNQRSMESVLSGNPSPGSSRRRSSRSNTTYHHRSPGLRSTSASTGSTLRVHGAAPWANGASHVVIQAVNHTMSGEFLYKYKRRVFGQGHGGRRHERFFKVDPYNRTLYWSVVNPALVDNDSKAKSGRGYSLLFPKPAEKLLPARIDSVEWIADQNPVPPGIYPFSIIVSTRQREMKLTAPSKESHDKWFTVRPSTASKLTTALTKLHRLSNTL